MKKPYFQYAIMGWGWEVLLIGNVVIPVEQTGFSPLPDGVFPVRPGNLNQEAIKDIEADCQLAHRQNASFSVLGEILFTRQYWILLLLYVVTWKELRKDFGGMPDQEWVDSVYRLKMSFLERRIASYPPV